MAVGEANITMWKIREVLNQQIEPQRAQQKRTRMPKPVHTHLRLIHTHII